MTGAGTETASPTGPASPARGRRHRRPSGAPPPLPRQIGATGKAWLGLAAVAILGLVVLPIVGQPDVAARFETSLLRQLARLRTEWLDDVMRGINAGGSRRGTILLTWGVVLALIALRRWRHLFTLLGSEFVLSLVGRTLIESVARPRPYGVTIIGRWGGFSMPSPPVAVLAVVLVAIVYTLGGPRAAPRWAKWVGRGGHRGVRLRPRLYLAVDHPSDVVYAIILGVAIPLVAFRWFTPNEAFPVTYRRAKKAHLDVEGPRGAPSGGRSRISSG